MKKYSFPLARVMAWRKTQAEIEEAKLETLHAELRGLESNLMIVRNDVQKSHRALVLSRAATGAELSALDSFRRSAAMQCAHLETAILGCRQRIATQLGVITQRRREFKLLEKLNDRKLTAWRADYARELDQQADELYLAARATGIHAVQRAKKTAPQRAIL
jgi:flagellar export protein FliJ